MDAGGMRQKIKAGFWFMIPFILVGGFLGKGAAVQAESVNALNPLFETLPAAQFREVKDWEKANDPEFPFSRTKGVFIGESDQGEISGAVVHLSSPGYGGPIGMLVAFDPAGRIIKVNVFRHRETECHIRAMTQGTFLDQFNGVTLWDKLRMMVGLKPAGQGDIQAMTGGTITSRAVTEGVAEARQVFYKLLNGGTLQ